MSWFGKLKEGLKKTSDKLSFDLENIFKNKKLDAQILESLEEVLISADINISVANKITQEFSKQKFPPNITNIEIYEKLAEIIENIISPFAGNLFEEDVPGLNIFIICGVNGNGKTTTIGKLANQFKERNKKVMIAACDTFRAAAVSQLEIWAERANTKIIKGPENADPASVAYKGIEEAIKSDCDYLFLDTAGRLHNQANLMAELTKIVNITEKFNVKINRKIILVLDATTGQNAYSQIELFSKNVALSGLIVTKLDGSSKAGVIVGIAGKYKLPIYAIGIGEKIEDLKPFNASDFARNLLNLQEK